MVISHTIFLQMRNKEIQVLAEFNKRTGYNAVSITPEKLELYRFVKNKATNTFLKASLKHLALQQLQCMSTYLLMGGVSLLEACPSAVLHK